MPKVVRPLPYMDLYLSQREAEGLKPKTLEKYSASISGFLVANPDLEDIADMGPMHATTWLVSMRRRGLSTGAINTYQRAVWTWFRWLYENDYVSMDISRRVKRVRVVDPKRRTATELDRRSLIIVAKDRPEHRYRNAALVEVLWSTGCRRSELAGVQYDDVDLRAGTVMLLGKGDKRRLSGIGVDARLALHEYIMRERGTQPGPLFVARTGVGMSTNAIRLVLESLCKSAGIKVASHDFRRACAARLLREGMAADDVARQLGHATLSMTLLYGEEGRTERALEAYHAIDQGVRPLRRRAG